MTRVLSWLHTNPTGDSPTKPTDFRPRGRHSRKHRMTPSILRHVPITNCALRSSHSLPSNPIFSFSDSLSPSRKTPPGESSNRLVWEMFQFTLSSSHWLEELQEACVSSLGGVYPVGKALIHFSTSGPDFPSLNSIFLANRSTVTTSVRTSFGCLVISLLRNYAYISNVSHSQLNCSGALVKFSSAHHTRVGVHISGDILPPASWAD